MTSPEYTLPQPPAGPPVIAARQKKLSGVAWLLAVGALALGVLLGSVATAVIMRPDSPSASGEDQQIVSACREGVQGKLKSPASAQFSKESIDNRDGTTSVVIHGTVDSQNGFGALVRTTFTCTMTKTSGKWEPLYVDVAS